MVAFMTTPLCSKIGFPPWNKTFSSTATTNSRRVRKCWALVGQNFEKTACAASFAEQELLRHAIKLAWVQPHDRVLQLRKAVRQQVRSAILAHSSTELVVRTSINKGVNVFVIYYPY
jgi:hypothetical protein